MPAPTPKYLCQHSDYPFDDGPEELDESEPPLAYPRKWDTLTEDHELLFDLASPWKDQT